MAKGKRDPESDRVMKCKKVVIIILNWNRKFDAAECIESLKHIVYPNYEITLVDNGSSDGSIEYIKKLYPYIKIIANNTNLGYAEGNNIGMRKALGSETDYLLLLNNDTIVDPIFLDELVKVAERNKKVGFIGPKVYYYEFNGRRDIINFVGGMLDKTRGICTHIGINEKDLGQYDETKEVDYIEGSCLLIKKQVIEEIGFFDPNFFAYWEEVDLCIRGRRAGYDSIIAPKARVWHKIASSNIKERNIYYLSRNRIWFMKKNSNIKEYISFVLYFLLREFFVQNLIYLYKGRLEWTAFNRGIIHGFFSNLPQKSRGK